jgi:hypothetical protein
MKPELLPTGAFEWKRRRRIIYATLMFCAFAAGVLLGAAVDGRDTSYLHAITYCVFGLATSVIGSYVFGAVWDDKNARDALNKGKSE